VVSRRQKPEPEARSTGGTPLSAAVVSRALERLARERALQTLVRGALPQATLKRLLKDALPRRAAAEMPPEVWSSLAVAIALQTPLFGLPLAEALHDRLAWDREPADMDGWWEAVVERPLEALWMAALSESKVVRKELAHIVQHCLENFRASPACTPPSWEFVEGLLDVQAETSRDLRDAEREAEDALRRHEAERERLEELREELKRLRRENAELRSERAEAERRAAALAAQAQKRTTAPDAGRVEELERRLRRSEKECAHLQRRLERLSAGATTPPAEVEAEPEASAPEASGADELEETEGGDLPPRQRILRHILRKLLAKGKIGASHTHEDNVYRGLPDHEKGLAKAAMDLLYREGIFVPKPTTTDPHVSLNPERTTEVRALIEGTVTNPRVQRFLEE
jgi:hypothetical protein